MSSAPGTAPSSITPGIWGLHPSCDDSVADPSDYILRFLLPHPSPVSPPRPVPCSLSPPSTHSRLPPDLTPLITSLLACCTPQTCPDMRAGEWQYLCAAHPQLNVNKVRPTTEPASSFASAESDEADLTVSESVRFDQTGLCGDRLHPACARLDHVDAQLEPRVSFQVSSPPSRASRSWTPELTPDSPIPTDCRSLLRLGRTSRTLLGG